MSIKELHKKIHFYHYKKFFLHWCLVYKYYILSIDIFILHWCQLYKYYILSIDIFIHFAYIILVETN